MILSAALKRHASFFLATVLMAMLPVVCSCVQEPEAEPFRAPEFVSVSAEETEGGILLRAVLSSGRADKCGFLISESDGGAEKTVYASLDGMSFEAVPEGLSPGAAYVFHAFAQAGKEEIVSEEASFRREWRDSDPVPLEDPAFEGWLLDRYDFDGNGVLTLAEASRIRVIDIYPTNEYNIRSLRGIEFLPNLRELRCEGEWYDTGSKSDPIGREHYYVGPYENSWDNAWGPIGTLEYADVSGNPLLRTLNLANNSALGVKMGKLDLSNNPALEELNLNMTWLEYPDIASLTSLTRIEFSHLRGELPNFVSLSELKILNVEYPQDRGEDNGSSIDVSGCPLLERLIVSAAVSSLSDLSRNPNLRELHWSFCPDVGPVDLSLFPDLEILGVVGCNLASLDVSGNPELRYLYANSNHLTEIDVSHNPALELLAVADNELTEIDVSHNPGLVRLDCWDNDLTSLDVRNNPSLTTLRCWGNRIEMLDVSKNLLLGTGEDRIAGLWCCQQEDGSGGNCLKRLIIAMDQVIPFVTENRNEGHVPAGTKIRIFPDFKIGVRLDAGGLGVLFWVSEDGYTALAVSVEEVAWKPWEEAYAWCRSYGDGGWDMPTIDQLTLLYHAYDAVNETLTAAGDTTLNSGNFCYWSSTEYEIPGYYYRERLWDGMILCYGSDEYKLSKRNFTRAVRKIREEDDD